MKNPHTWCGGFSRFNVLSSFSSLPSLALVFHVSLCFLTFWSLKVPIEWGYRQTFHIHLHISIFWNCECVATGQSSTGGSLGQFRSCSSRCAICLVTRHSPYRPPNPRNSKTQKSDSKVTFGLPTKVTQKLLKSDSNVTFGTVFVTFETLFSNFWVTLAASPKVTFESLFCVFEFSGVWGSVGEWRVSAICL